MNDRHEPEPKDRQEVIRSEHSGDVESHEEVRISHPEDIQPQASTGPDPGAVDEHRERYLRDVATERRLMLEKASQVVWLLVTIVDGMIALRLLLKLIAANPESPFASFVYNFTALFLWPFAGLTISPSSGGMVLEISSIIAFVFYILLGWLIVRAIWVLFEETMARSSSSYDRFRK